jgi:hypothetical protein
MCFDAAVRGVGSASEPENLKHVDRTHMMDEARRARGVFRFIRLNSPVYLKVLDSDLHAFRDELIRASAGLVVGAIAGLLFVSFLSAAVVISAWDSHSRILAAWSVTAGWLAIALAGLNYARRALRAPVPFANLTRLLQKDLAAIERGES